MKLKRIEEVLGQLAEAYPPDMVRAQRRDIPRVAFHVALAMGGRDPASLRVADIGGGVGLFAIGCAAVGVKRVVLIDDFRDPINLDKGDRILDMHRNQGVEIEARDVIRQGLDGIKGEFDAVTCFEAMEHCHHSPKRMLHQANGLLASGGRLILSAPNCFRLSRRIFGPLGRGGWSAMADWYEAKVFRGHVREPSVADLRYIARDLGLADSAIYGQNWVVLTHPNALVRRVGRFLNPILRLRPSLCSEIYLTGRRPD